MSLNRTNPRRDRNERLLVEYLKKAGGFVTRISGAGVPDLLVGYRGRWLLLEVKAPRGRATLMQQAFHDAAQALGLPCHTVYTVEDCQRVLRKVTGEGEA